MSASTDMTPTLGSIFQIVRGKDPHGPSADLFKNRWKQYLKVWDAALGKQKYAAGNEVTLADFSLYAGYARAKGAIARAVRRLPERGALGQGNRRAPGDPAGAEVLGNCRTAAISLAANRKEPLKVMLKNNKTPSGAGQPSRLCL